MLLFGLVLLLNILPVTGQQNLLPRNHAGIMAGIEWNTISGLAGLTYEHSVFSQDKIQAGLKVLYILPYEPGNFKLLGNECCDEIQSTSVWATGYYFTAAAGKPKRFYLESAIGAGVKKYMLDGITYKSLYPGFEAGFGVFFPVSKKVYLKWHNAVIFLHNNGGSTATQLAIVF